MIIKSRIVGESNLTVSVGMVFLRYLCSDIYDKGVIISFTDHEFVVDFLDTVRIFNPPEVLHAYTAEHEDHLISCSEGIITKDFRRGVVASDEEIDLEDLLDFEKWMI